MTQQVRMVAVLALVCLPLVGAQEGVKRVEKLCADTLAALQQTESKPLADVLSAQASSFLAVQDGKVVLLSRDKLQEPPKWAEQPLFSEQAKLGEVKPSDRLYATRVDGTITDGEREYRLSGVAATEGEVARWLMLAVLPRASADADAEQAGTTQVAAEMSAWRQSLEQGEVEKTLAVFSPQVLSFSALTPDYGFYVFKDKDSVSELLGQAAGAGLKMTETAPAEIVIRGPVGAARMKLGLAVMGLEAMPLDVLVHAYRDGETWMVTGLSALPPEAK